MFAKKVAVPKNGLGNTILVLLNSSIDGTPVFRASTNVSLPGKVTDSLVDKLVAVTLSTKVDSPIPVKVIKISWLNTGIVPNSRISKVVGFLMTLIFGSQKVTTYY